MLKLTMWLYPLTLLAFMGGSVQYFSLVFTSKTRWGFLLLLAGYLLFRKVRSSGNEFVFLSLYLYLLWCFSTAFWSEAFALSLAKIIALTLVIFAMVLGGESWTLRQGGKSALDYLLPTAWLAMAAAVLGFFLNPAAFDGHYYQGFVYGSNMFGSLMGMSLPWFLWQAYLHRESQKIRYLWLMMPCLSFVFIFMSQSRAALLMALCTLGGLLLSASMRKGLIWLYAIIMMFVLAVWFRPDLIQSSIKQVVFKHSDEVFSTRYSTWEESLAAANQGGWVGVGYGAAVGGGEWQGGLTAVGYGREKGNSQLAIIEETGIIGLSLYIMIILSVLVRMGRSFRHARRQELRLAVGIVLGAWIGMHAQSCFEGWWVAPGSPESVAFWALTGVGLGLCTLVDRENKQVMV